MSAGQMMLERPLVLLGAGGHAKVLLSLIEACGYEVLGVCDPGLAREGATHWRGIKVLGADDFVLTLDPLSIGLANGIGQLVGSIGRRQLFDTFHARGFVFPTLVHPTAWLDKTAALGQGVQVMAGAVVQVDVVIGENSIINTRASIDHDCQLGCDVHIAPGATLCGGVLVADRAFVASGATVIQGLSIGADAVVGAGAVLVKDLDARETLLGAVARRKAGHPNL
ncbi:acetyltransferase [Pseudomonas proteolytica]|uniref:acetyltransferase n=1 Tax=Pseudomonas proteolytica TaxID=219574 RepID=UPI001CA3E6CF|nr:acetyltransferase [Pseudomonas proteolytica]